MGATKSLQGSVLYDAAGNPVGSVDAAGNFRLLVDMKIEEGYSLAVHTQLIPSDPANLLRGFATNGGSPDLRVDGSGTPVVFTHDAESGPGAQDVKLGELRFVFSISELKFEPAGNFGALGPLSSGILIEIRKGGVVTTISTVKRNEDLLLLAGGSIPFSSKNTDVLVAIFGLGGAITLTKDTTDRVQVTIQDNITDSSYHYLQCAVFGTKEV